MSVLSPVQPAAAPPGHPGATYRGEAVATVPERWILRSDGTVIDAGGFRWGKPQEAIERCSTGAVIRVVEPGFDPERQPGTGPTDARGNRGGGDAARRR